MNAQPESLATITRCAGCNKSLDDKHAERIGFQSPGEPEEVQTFCRKCAYRIACNIIRLERQQQGTLIA